MTRADDPAWCGKCDERTRLIGDPPRRCGACHPIASRNKGAPARSSGLVRLSDVKARKVRWLWPGRFPAGNLCMIDGDPGVGKSTIAVDMAARVSSGRRWPDGAPNRKGAVLILTAEEGLADTVLPRVELAEGNPANVLVLDTVPADPPRLPSLPLDIPYIESVVKDYGVRLVVIDVLASYLGGDGREVNSHQDTHVRRALYPLYKMADRTGACVVALRHLNKMTSQGNAMYRGGGSIAITGQARAVHLAALDPDDQTETRRILCPVKVNQAPKTRALAYQLAASSAESGAPARVMWAGEDGHTAADLLGEQLAADDRYDRDHTVRWIQDYLVDVAGHEAPYGQIQAAARNAGIAERTLKGARRRAGVGYRRAGWQSGTIWVLDEDVAAQLKAERDAS